MVLKNLEITHTGTYWHVLARAGLYKGYFAKGMKNKNKNKNKNKIAKLKSAPFDGRSIRKWGSFSKTSLERRVSNVYQFSLVESERGEIFVKQEFFGAL